MTEGERDHFMSWELAIACLRVEKEAGRKLTPQEMLARLHEQQHMNHLPDYAALIEEGDRA